jgi:hypothetical protein
MIPLSQPESSAVTKAVTQPLVTAECPFAEVERLVLAGEKALRAVARDFVQPVPDPR